MRLLQLYAEVHLYFQVLEQEQVVEWVIEKLLHATLLRGNNRINVITCVGDVLGAGAAAVGDFSSAPGVVETDWSVF